MPQNKDRLWELEERIRTLKKLLARREAQNCHPHIVLAVRKELNDAEADLKATRRGFRYGLDS